MISESDRCPDEHEEGDTTRRDHQGAGRTILKETFGKGSKGLRVELNLKEDGWLGETVFQVDRVACAKMGTEKSLVWLVEGVKGVSRECSETEAGVRAL